ncbi:DEAD/DEAH box helicase [Maritalea sp.]|jgi:SNF2 family DNA or RNA helicase|uniref:DEAD/DEAH box helicase n=1 Tax=Maritalea sp. TaxID=2003361 RepID=UPI0039E48FF1
MSDVSGVSVAVDNSGHGIISISSTEVGVSIWSLINSAILSHNFEHKSTGHSIRLSWPDTLTIVREFGTKSCQSTYSFRFLPSAEAKRRLSEFAEQMRSVRMSRKVEPTVAKTNEELLAELTVRGFSKRKLKDFQLRDLSRLLALSNGANFSVPGAGKTTVTFALHILLQEPNQHLMIVAPKAAFQAWKDVVEDCIDPSISPVNAEHFTVLDGTEEQTSMSLSSGARRFIISYDLAIRQQSTIANHLASIPTHLILDESHRMKAGYASQRGSFLLGIAALPVRRDILSGTPMPQAASDMESQLEFLWPGQGLGLDISYGTPPREVLGNLYVRTTKKELGLPEATRRFIDVPMGDGQLALYSIIRDEFLRNYAKSVSKGLGDGELAKARRSVMRLLQLSVSPSLALNAMANDDVEVSSAIVDSVLEEGHSQKLQAVMDHARELAHEGKKVVIWTIFTGTILSLDSALADLNPVYIHGGVPSGDASDETTREGKIRRFHEDPNCSVLIANPAAAGEGISLHTVCHNAIYVDRSYVSTHYLQSIDRIHRLGLSPDQETNIFVYRTKAPAEIGSIDLSVSRRLTQKIRNMQELLNDPDLHKLAYDEEQADDPIDYDVRLQDIIDLISELENKAPDIADEAL